jgi:ribonuclease HI
VWGGGEWEKVLFRFAFASSVRDTSDKLNTSGKNHYLHEHRSRLRAIKTQLEAQGITHCDCGSTVLTKWLSDHRSKFCKAKAASEETGPPGPPSSLSPAPHRHTNDQANHAHKQSRADEHDHEEWRALNFLPPDRSFNLPTSSQERREERARRARRFLATLPDHATCCFTDGAAESRPRHHTGPTGSAAVVYLPCGAVCTAQRAISQGTNNIGELDGIGLVGDILHRVDPSLIQDDMLFLLSDSDYALGALSGRNEININHDLIDDVVGRLGDFRLAAYAVPSHTSIPGNDRADQEAKEAMEACEGGHTWPEACFKVMPCDNPACRCRRQVDEGREPPPRTKESPPPVIEQGAAHEHMEMRMHLASNPTRLPCSGAGCSRNSGRCPVRPDREGDHHDQ